MNRKATRAPRERWMSARLTVAFIAWVVAAFPAGASPRAETAIRALLDRWEKAFAKKDVAGVMAMYATGSRLVSYDIVPPLQYKGYDAYRKDYEAYFDQFAGPLTVEERDVHIGAQGEIGYAFGLERLAGTLKSGDKVDNWTRFTTIFRKINGRWYAVHDHISVPTDFETGKSMLDLHP